MDLNKNFIRAIASKEAAECAKAIFNGSTKRYSIELFDISFSLFQPIADGPVNFEVLVQQRKEGPPEEINVPNYGQGMVNDVFYYLKPLGYFNSWPSDEFTADDITIFYELQETGQNMCRSGEISSQKHFCFLSLEKNALMGAFSMDIVERAKLYRDSKIRANGLDFDILISFDGYPQSFLNDKYGVNGPIGAYPIRELGTVNPMTKYKSLYDELERQALFSAFKSI